MTTDYTHPQYDKYSPLWAKTRDACAGEDAVKAKAEVYLPNPDELCQDPVASAARYRAYLRRATYYNATGRTLAGLLGVAFSNLPQVKTSKKELLQDADGSGVGLVNQAQGVLADVMQTGRGGLLADYSAVDEVTRKRIKSVWDQEQAGVRAIVCSYSAESILTWETQGNALTRVVLLESSAVYEGGEVRYIPQLRELLLAENGYNIKVWQKHSDKGQFILKDTFAVGLKFIPFVFVGAINNDAHPDLPPLLDLANLNLAHYRNSADFEESVFLLGQPQLVFTGATQEWKEQAGSIVFGSRAAMVAPPDGDAKLLQVAPNTLAQEAMRDKEGKMQALGARLMAQTEAVKTATQSAAETKAAYSQLSLACDNVSAAYTRVLRWLETWGSGRTSGAFFAIDTQFNELTLDANAIRETVAAWQAGIVPQSDAIRLLQRLNVIDQEKTVEQVRDEIEGQGPSLNLDEAA
ncbi:DUF4055 domain-containing protein [Lysobacter niastensis]|uniref:DUF4055 domain-containing protein n=1 Tax=Lysobacter niastensis TaxID=380629 RepID=A0ABS0B3F9_9GAMM|nr:DUF4055 domain-containing protein [Lysobacter niastensis]MBF6022868.1 DUF4055 domain-containing protein [Lysobacter niastensis]